MRLSVNECIARGLMPQVDEKDIPELLFHLEAQGVRIDDICIDPKTIRGKQKVDRKKVRAIGYDLLTKPLLVSSEPFIIDGNHRWMAGVFRGWARMRAFQIMLPFGEAIRAVFEFPKTYTIEGQPIRN